MNVILNDPWGCVSVSDTASCRPNNTSVQWLAEASQNWLDKGRRGRHQSRHTRDYYVTARLSSRAHALYKIVLPFGAHEFRNEK